MSGNNLVIAGPMFELLEQRTTAQPGFGGRRPEFSLY
jgi:hypothetical protein